MRKTKEIVFHRSNPRTSIVMPALQAIEKIKETKLLGVIFSDGFHFDSHVNYILKICSQRSFREISDKCDSSLFKGMLNSYSCIHQLLPSIKNEIKQLRPRGHRFTLTNYKSQLYKASFVNRCLFACK